MPAKSPKDDRAYVYDMLESARQAASYLEGQTLAQFMADTKTQDAVVLRLAMIDDFAGQLAPATVASLPAVTVRSARCIRSRIADPGGRVDFPVAWKIARQELSPLVAVLEKYLRAVG